MLAERFGNRLEQLTRAEHFTPDDDDRCGRRDASGEGDYVRIGAGGYDDVEFWRRADAREPAVRVGGAIDRDASGSELFAQVATEIFLDPDNKHFIQSCPPIAERLLDSTRCRIKYTWKDMFQRRFDCGLGRLAVAPAGSRTFALRVSPPRRSRLRDQITNGARCERVEAPREVSANSLK